MSLKQFLPFITNDQGVSQAIVNGVVVDQTIPTPLEASPEGWEENTVQFQRNKEFIGVFKSYITNLIFHFDGAKIIRHYLYKFGTEIVLFFIWLKLDQAFGANMMHKGWYKGEIDLTTCRDGYNGITVNLTEGGFNKELNANKGVPYAIDLETDENTVTLYNDGMDILYEAKFIITNGFSTDDPNYEYGNHVVDLEELQNEFGAVGSIGAVPRTKTPSTTLETTNLWFLKATTSGNATIDYDYTITAVYTAGSGSALNPAANLRHGLIKIAADNTRTPYPFYISPGFGFIEGTHHIAGSIVIPLVDGDRLFFYSLMNPVGAGGDAQMAISYGGENPFFNVSFKFRLPPSNHLAQRFYDVGNTLCRKMSNNRSGLVSDKFSADYNLLVTSGDAIRNIPGSLIKTRFSDWYKTADAVKCVALSVENNQCRVENRQTQFNNNQIVNLGQAKIPDDGFITIANEYIHDTVEIGYPKRDIGDVNGRYSFNNTYTYKAPVLKGERNAYDMKCPWYADPYVIEIMRTNLDKKNTTDGTSDNDVFLIDAEKILNDILNQNFASIYFNSTDTSQLQLIGVTGLNLMPGVRFRVKSGINRGTYTITNVAESAGSTFIYMFGVNLTASNSFFSDIEFMWYRLRRLPYTSITGIPNPETVFNIELTVARIIKNHYSYLRGGWKFLESLKATFQITDKTNSLLVTTMGTDVIAENADIQISSMDAPYFQPRWLNYSVKSPFNLLELMSTNGVAVNLLNSRGYFTAMDGSQTLKGYPESIKTNDATLETQEYKMLATADTDLEYRINSN